MLNKKAIVFLTLFLNLLFAGNSDIFAGNQDISKAKAVELFEAGNYGEALPLFKGLLQQSPDEPMLNYYYGAARTETDHFSEQDLNFLQKAREGDVPEKVNYYLGLQYQAQEDWTNALKFYNTFQLKASVERRKELKIAERIQQCFNEENPFTLTEPVQLDSIPQIKTEPKTEVTTQERRQAPEISRIETLDDISLVRNKREKQHSFRDYPVEFQVNSEITYYNTSHFKTEEGRKLFDKADDLKNELEFSMNQMEELRAKYRSAQNPEERQDIGEKILIFENEAFELKDDINRLLTQVRSRENEYWQNASPQEAQEFAKKAEQLAAAQRQKTSEPEAENISQDSEFNIDPELLLDDNETVDLYAEKGEKEEDLIYKIQIGAYSRGLPSYVKRLYDKLSLIRKIENYTDDEGVVVYTTGNLKNLEDAVKMRDQVRQEGVEDAFVVPYFKGKRITLEEAKKLETGS